MPNWVYNRVHGSNKAVRALLNDEGYPSFQQLVPEPEELELLDDTSFSASPILGKALLDAFYHNNDKGLIDYYNRVCAPKMSYEDFIKQLTTKCPLHLLSKIHDLYEKTDCIDWRSWREKYWGCKWDAKRFRDEPYTGDEEEIEFETPWSPPEAIIKTIANRFPDLEFTWHADEESCSFSIDYEFNGDGTITEVDAPPEYYTPYIMDKEDLEEVIIKCKTLTELHTALANCLGEVNRDVNASIHSDDENKANVTITVYDWEINGGEALYDITVEDVIINE